MLDIEQISKIEGSAEAMPSAGFANAIVKNSSIRSQIARELKASL